MVFMECGCHCRASFTAHVRLQLPYVWSMEGVFRHAEVSSRVKERETSSQKVTSARPYAFGWAWGRLERSCAMMRSLRYTELRLLVVVFSTQTSNT